MVSKIAFILYALCATCALTFARAKSPEQALKILINPGPTYSHWLPVIKISRELEARGHSLKYLYSSDLEDLTEKYAIPFNNRISFKCTSPVADFVNAVMKLKAEGREGEMMTTLMDMHSGFSKGAIEDESSTATIRDWGPDLVFFDAALPAAAPVADLLQIPHAAIHVFPPMGSFFNFAAGTSTAPSLIPNFPGWVKQPMSLLDRAKNLINWVLGIVVIRAFDHAYSPMWTQHGMPHLGYIKSLHNTAAMIYQGDWAYVPALPMSPHAHVLGSFTAEPAKALQGNLGAFCDSASSVIYVCSGSSAVPDIHMLGGVHKALTHLATTVSVVWKLTAGDQALLKQHELSIPKNVFVTEFAPQNDVLGHPSLKAFVTQGGSNSILEGLYHGAPMIVIPLAHQISRTMRAERWTPVQKAASVIEHAVLLVLALSVAQAFQLSEERIVFQTEWGDLQLALYPEVAPETVAHILQLARLGGYNSNHFFRVDKGFVAQTADVASGRTQALNAQQKAEEEKRVPLEVRKDVKHDRRGLLSMARYDDPNSGGSSFSITLGPAPHLDMQYTIFGEVTDGLPTLAKFEEMPTTKSGIFVMPAQRVEIRSSYVYRPDAQVKLAHR
ncbi:hypothetical protein WJX73_001257 [Symbiochloris irregularis]|uniref:PPIase cyclophilin-type domain-containing protein n=1 Tax=Symbiochloris irregularis TaxID=706552 RepID=A0AAW1NLB4_9CHLO